MSRISLRRQEGFTLLEVMIAFAILSFILAAVFIAQGNGLASSARARNVVLATNLVKNLIAEKEMLYEGRDFEKIDKKQEGKFPAPNDHFGWKLEVEEVDFSALTNILLAQAQKNQQMNPEQAGMLLKMFENYLKKSVRRMTVTVEYPDGKGTSNLTFTELLVNYDADFTSGI